MIDSFTYSSSPGLNISFRRIPDGSENWATGAASLGNFNESGQTCVIAPTPTATPTAKPTLTPTLTPTPRKSPSPTPDDGEELTDSSAATEEVKPDQESEVYNLNGKPALSPPEVLGDFIQQPQKSKLPKLFSLLSASYSALTVLGIFLRIKVGA